MTKTRKVLVILAFAAVAWFCYVRIHHSIVEYEIAMDKLEIRRLEAMKPSPFPLPVPNPFQFGPPPLQFKDGIPSFGVPGPGSPQQWHDFFNVPAPEPEPGSWEWYNRLPPEPPCTVMDEADTLQPQCKRVSNYI